jgi:UDP-N-acetylmuramoyl-L-alanyl-D-glutamate--2,6-diaminopimelate ligase
MLKLVPDGLLEGTAPLRELAVTGVHHDSRTVAPGGLFVAIRGLAHDGQDHIGQAVAAGAAAVVSDRDPGETGRPWIRTNRPRRALAYLSQAFFEDPSARMTIVGVTGTNGKTTVCALLRDAWRSLGRGSASMGTLGVETSDPSVLRDVSWPSMTTPEAPDFVATLRRLLAAGVDHVAAEVSSHALVLERVVGTRLRAVLFTTFGRDHLDFHGTMEAYREAKWRLFTPEGRGDRGAPPDAVVNADDPVGREFAQALIAKTSRGGIGWEGKDGGRVVTYGLGEEHDPWLAGHVLDSGIKGLLMEISWPGGSTSLRVPLIGKFQAGHILAAFGTLLALGVGPEEASRGLSHVRIIPGRMEPVGEGAESLVLVDYGHTPDALEVALRESRALAEGRLIVVFGCGGDRDRGKRPLMGLAAGRLADEVILTTDNPRGEDPREIADQVLEGLRATSARHQILLDRREALKEGIGRLTRGDVLLVAGRGAEAWQVFADRKIPFDDRQVLREILSAGAAE